MFSFFLPLSADEDVALSGFKEKFKTYVIVDSKGLNKWMSPATFKSSCDMAVRYYPFDKQKCEMTFGSWTYDSRLLKTINPHTEHSPAGQNPNQSHSTGGLAIQWLCHVSKLEYSFLLHDQVITVRYCLHMKLYRYTFFSDKFPSSNM